MIQPNPNDSQIVAHARRELQMCGAFEVTPDYDGSVGRALLALMKVFAKITRGDLPLMEAVKQGFNSLSEGALLSPPTDDPDEWEMLEREDNKRVWRNKRSPFYITTDRGKSWINIATKERGKSRNHITGEDPEEENDGREESEQAGKAENKPESTEGDEAQVADTGNRSHDRNTGKLDRERSNKADPAKKKDSVDGGVEPKGKPDPKPKKDAPPKPEKGKNT